MTTLESSPVPNQSAMSGARARIGIAWAATMYGERSRAAKRERASSTPTGTPRPAPTTKPRSDLLERRPGVRRHRAVGPGADEPGRRPRAARAGGRARSRRRRRRAARRRGRRRPRPPARGRPTADGADPRSRRAPHGRRGRTRRAARRPRAGRSPGPRRPGGARPARPVRGPRRPRPRGRRRRRRGPPGWRPLCASRSRSRASPGAAAAAARTAMSATTCPGRGERTTTRSARKIASGTRVGHEHDRRRGLGPDAQQLEVEALAGQRVERAERLVEQEHGRPQRERAGDGHALAHAARQLVRTRAGRRRSGRPGRAARRSAPAGRAPGMPASSSGKATLSAASRQGRRRGSWKTKPTRGSGPVTGLAVDRDRARVRREQAGDARAGACSCRSRSGPGWPPPADRRSTAAHRRGRAAAARRSTGSCARGR